MTRRRVPSWSERWYALLVHVLFPPRFRDRFGEEVCDLFRDRLHDERDRAGRLGVALLWLRAIPDLCSTAVRERAAAIVSPVPTLPLERTDSMSTLLLNDARYAMRAFRRHPFFFGIAVLVVALGAGAVSTIFSVANAVVLRPIPGARDASTLVEVTRTRAGGRGGSLSSSYSYYRHLVEHSHSLEGLASWGMMELTINTGGQGVQALGNAVSGNYFSVLGVRPALGAFFSGRDDVALGNEPVAVISHAFWQRQLGGDSSVIGRTVRVNAQPLTVVAVAPARFSGVYPALRTDVWVPLAMRTTLRGRPAPLDGGGSWMQLVGRLAPGSSPARAREELSALSAQFVTSTDERTAQGPSEYVAANASLVAGLPSDVSGAVAGFLGVLLAIAALVLLIASVNVASMLLARAVVRRREIAMRLALGATRRRLVRQLLVESVLLFGAGGAAGTLLAIWGTRLLQRIELPIDVPLELDIAPDARVLLVTLAVALITGLLFGLAPAFQGSRLDVQSTLRSDSAGAGRRRSRLRDGLIVGQIAMSLLLLSSAGLFIRALGRGRAADPGFSVDGVVTATIDLESAGYDTVRARTFFRTLSDRIALRPGVQAVSYARILPLSMSSSGIDVVIAGQAPPGGRPGDPMIVSTNTIDPGFFSALRIPFVRGRDFARTDDANAPKVAIVNEVFAARYFPSGDAVGQLVSTDSTPITIVGVVRNARFKKLDEAPEPFIFLPTQQQWRAANTLLVRTDGSAEGVTVALLREMAALDPTLPSPRVTTLRQATAVVLLPQRVAAAVTGALGLTGLLLAAVGLYGILSFSTAQRTREIGVRLALGASRVGIVRMVLGEGVRLVGIGVAAGLALAVIATRVLRPFLFGINPLDPLTFATIGVILCTVAMIATWLPARRASRVDPMSSMRSE